MVAPSCTVDAEIVRATSVFQLPFGVEGLREALYKARRLFATAANAVVRAHWAEEGAALDRILADTGRMPTRGVDWPSAKLSDYQVARAAAPDLAVGIAAQASYTAARKWRQVRWEALVRQTLSPPHYRESGTFQLRAADVVLRERGGQYELGLSLGAGRHEGGKQFWLPLTPRDDRQRLELASLTSGAWKIGALSILEHRRKRKWLLRMSYKRLAPRMERGNSAAINRGMRAFLVGVTETGSTWRYEAQDIEAYLRRMQARRKSYQYASRGSARDGRGRARLLAPTDALRERATRWRATKCQTIARRFVRWLEARRVTRLFIEDFTGIRSSPEENLDHGSPEFKRLVWNRIQEWPYYELGRRIESCCEEAGIEVVAVSAEYDSRTSPICRRVSVDGDAIDWHKHWYRCPCPKCKGGRPIDLDVVAASNALARGLSDNGISHLRDRETPAEDTARKPGRKGAPAKRK